MTAFKTIIYAGFGIGMLVGVCPFVIRYLGLAPFEFGPLRWLGVPVALVGAVMYAACAYDFVRQGRGTPAFFDPPRRLVINPWFRFVRNPMYIGVVLMIAAEGLWFGDLLQFMFAAIVLVVFHLIVTIYEEPHLRSLYGAGYESYCGSVPRWTIKLDVLTSSRKESVVKFALCLAIAMAFVSNGAMASDDEFVNVANEYIEHLMTVNPEWATGAGDHRFDHLLTDRSAKAVAERAAADERFLEKLRKIDKSSLNETNRIDCLILENNLEWGIFQARELKEHEWNPLNYNTSGAIYGLVAREFAPLEKRLESVAKRLDGVAAVIAAAKQNLKNPPLVFTETAILQNKGSIGLIRNELDTFIDMAPSTREMLAGPRERAIAALEEYGKWLDEDLLPRSDGDFRLGDEKWRKKLRFSLDSDLSKEDILRLAKADLVKTQKEMYETALPLYKKYQLDVAQERKEDDIKYVCKSVLDRLAVERPNNETIVDEARRILAEATAFVRVNKLVTVPDEPVKLIVMPEFQRGVAIAYCDPPGPLDKNLSTFYSIAPTPEDWTAERVESFFKEYNNYMLVDLTVHEAVPGHYLQLAHSNKFEAPTLVRALFQSGPFVEGWAVYTEKLMADAGFGGPEVKMQQLKMRLRVIINAIIDQEIHTNGMTEDEAMAMMMNEGFQEDGEAAGKWRRACLSSTQLSTYFVGSAEVEDIVAACRARHGKDSDTMKMHDKIISYGSPSARYIKKLMGL